MPENNEPDEMRRRERRKRALRRIALAIVAGALPTLGSCRASRSAQPDPVYLGDFREVGPRHVDKEYRSDWEALTRAREADPAAPAVIDAADRLLARDPPLDLRLSAWLAKAEQAYLAQEDARAIVIADEALSNPGDDAHAPIVAALATIRVRALVRGGDPARALAALEEARLSTLDEEERRGLRAVALDRDGQPLDAVLAYARWRGLLEDDDPAAAYAEERFVLLSAGISAESLSEVASSLPDEPARECLRVRAGVHEAAPKPGTWVARCGRSTARVGILLPRTGPLSALADVQLAAASVGAQVLAEGGGVEILWRDAGSSTTRAVGAARELLAEGADVLIGPLGAANARAVSKEVGPRALVILPGERVGDARGVAPTLESRVAQLVAHARGQGSTRFLVAAPDNAYGRRAVAAIRAALEPSVAKSLIIQTYPPDTTSFAPLVAPLIPALRKGSALIVPDHLSRVELLVRQLSRLGPTPSVDGSDGALMLSTAEGASPAALKKGNDVLEGLWLAPAAAETDESRAFVQAFTAAQGEPPSDQALLVFHALRRALGSGSDRALQPLIMRVERGNLVSSRTPQG